MNQLIEAGAWTDVALAMVELELPYLDGFVASPMRMPKWLLLYF